MESSGYLQLIDPVGGQSVHVGKKGRGFYTGSPYADVRVQDFIIVEQHTYRGDLSNGRSYQYFNTKSHQFTMHRLTDAFR
ncbi:hypothetical protein D3C86_1929540 [compost metagenome]